MCDDHETPGIYEELVKLESRYVWKLILRGYGPETDKKKLGSEITSPLVLIKFTPSASFLMMNKVWNPCTAHSGIE